MTEQELFSYLYDTIKNNEAELQVTNYSKESLIRVLYRLIKQDLSLQSNSQITLQRNMLANSMAVIRIISDHIVINRGSVFVNIIQFADGVTIIPRVDNTFELDIYFYNVTSKVKGGSYDQ